MDENTFEEIYTEIETIIKDSKISSEDAIKILDDLKAEIVKNSE